MHRIVALLGAAAVAFSAAAADNKPAPAFTKQQLTALPKDGWLTPSDRPGFGLEIPDSWFTPFFN